MSTSTSAAPAGLPSSSDSLPASLSQRSSSYRPVELPDTASSSIGRCDSCYGYINPFVAFDHQSRWICSLCAAKSSADSFNALRYSKLRARPTLPELYYPCIDIPLSPLTQPQSAAAPAGSPLLDVPVYIVLVDATGSLEMLSAVRSAVAALLESLPSSALFGLLTFDERIGIFDLQPLLPSSNGSNGSTEPSASDKALPHIKHVRLGDKEPSLWLEQVMDVQDFLLPVSQCKETVLASLECLPSLFGVAGRILDPAIAHSPAPASSVASSKRKTYAAVSSILDFLARHHVESRLFAHLLLFVAGPATSGFGSTPSSLQTKPAAAASAASKTKKGAAQDETKKQLQPGSTAFADLARRAVGLACCVDIVGLSDAPLDLASLKPLALWTGGKIFLPPAPAAESTLPHDLYRRFSSARAMNSMLRIRCSPELQFTHVYDQFDSEASGASVTNQLLSINHCDRHRCISFDIEYTSPEGLSKPHSVDDFVLAPTIQIAFLFTHVSSKSDVEDRQKPLVEKRLRLLTCQVAVAKTLDDLFNSAQPEVIMSLMTNKMVLHCLEEGIQEARLLLRDWMVVLLKKYHDFQRQSAAHALPESTPTVSVASEDSQANEAQSSRELAFSAHPSLQMLPRLVYGLLRHGILCPSLSSADAWVANQSLLGALPPRFLSAAIYPHIYMFASTLSRVASRTNLPACFSVMQNLQHQECAIIDAFHTLIVVLSQVPSAPDAGTGSHSINLLPREGLRGIVDVWKKELPVTPAVVCTTVEDVRLRIRSDAQLPSLLPVPWTAVFVDDQLPPSAAVLYKSDELAESFTKFVEEVTKLMQWLLAPPSL